MKNIKNRLYLDGWRKVSKDLFDAYIICYKNLEINSDLDPRQELVKALEEKNILGKVKPENYGAAYIPARELGIFYQDENGKYILGNNARKYTNNAITYEEYMKGYILNYMALINGVIIYPFQIITEYSLNASNEKDLDEVFEDCKSYFSSDDTDNQELAKSSLGKFLDRGIESGTLTKNGDKYAVKDVKVYAHNYVIPEMTPEEFSETFMGGSRSAQENIVKIMIDRMDVSNTKLAFDEFIKKFTKEELAIYVQFLKDIITKFDLKKGDERLVFTFRDGRLNFTVGQRYSWNISIIDNERFGVISSEKLNETSAQYKGSENATWYTYLNIFKPTSKELDLIFQGIKTELERSNKSSYRNKNQKEFENYIFDLLLNANIMKHPLNQILFGPPGTGKTYTTITKALNIIGLLEEKDSYTKEEYEAAQELFQNELGKRIEFVTMHQSFSYEDFVQGLKPRKTDDGKGITFDYKNGVFKATCERADESKLLLKRSTTTEETILIDKLFPSFLLSIDEQSVYDTLSAKKFEGKKITQKIAIEYFNEKLGKKYCKAWRDKFDYVLGNKSPRVGYQADKFRDGELEDFKEYSETFGKLTPEKRKEKLITEWIDDKPETIIAENILNNHVIILDEINRANISRVFGELIALIEKDKRDGKLTATLPSGDPFTVPSNLFIIGTMNTADKSIALVDIALRRRFKFIPLYPNSELLRSVLKENKIEQEEIEKRVNLMTNLNKIIRAKKSVDFEIGHSYFMENETLINILNNQVLPLLNEYFMYDLRKVKEIIEKTQKDKEGNNIPKLGINLNQSIWKDRGLLEVESIDTEAELVEDALDEADENNSDS